MEISLACAALGIPAGTPLTVAVVEAGFARATEGRHPSLYAPGTPDRATAETWFAHANEARNALLLLIAPPAVATPTAAAAAPPAFATLAVATPAAQFAPRAKRRLSPAAIGGIVAGGIALVGLIGFGVVAVSAALTGVAESVAEDIENGASPGQTDEEEEHLRYSADETFFTFPAAMAYVEDDRYDDLCSGEFAEGCWTIEITPESDCGSLEVALGYSNDEVSDVAEDVDSMVFDDVRAGETVPVVFGNDAYDYGWITDVVCLESGS